jgi:hypothetical protein
VIVADGQRVDRRAIALVLLLAVVVAAPSLANGFAYDDEWIIVRDTRIHDLARWTEWLTRAYWTTDSPALYRPLTTTLLGLQWAVADGAPWVFHTVNVLLHGAVTVAVLWLASLLVAPPVAIGIGAVFAVHPVHVEAVANIVGQGELLAGLSIVLGLALYIHARQRDTFRRETVLWLGLIYLLGITAKEHAFVLPALWGIAERTVLRGGRELRAVVQRTWPAYALATGLAVALLWARHDILGSVGGTSVHPAIDGIAAWPRFLVMLGVFPEIVRVLLWPRHLHADYSPAHILVSPTPDLSQLNGVVVVIAVLVLSLVALRRSPVATLGIAMFILPWLPTANLLFPSGVLLAERALYTPSVGFLLAAGVGVDALWRRYRASAPAVVPVLALGIALVLASVRSVDRAPAWASSDRIFWELLQEQPLSFKAHYAWGGILLERGDFDGAIREWRMATRIYPEYFRPHYDLALLFARRGRCDQAIPIFALAIEKGGGFPDVHATLVDCQILLGRYRDAVQSTDAALSAGLDPGWFGGRRRLADSVLAAADSLP